MKWRLYGINLFLSSLSITILLLLNTLTFVRVTLNNSDFSTVSIHQSYQRKNNDTVSNKLFKRTLCGLTEDMRIFTVRSLKQQYEYII